MATESIVIKKFFLGNPLRYILGKVTKFHRPSITTSGATEQNLTGGTKSDPHPGPYRVNNYSFDFTPVETSPDGTLLYIANHLSYKCRNYLMIYEKNELESIYIEIVNPNKLNINVEVI